MEPDEEIDRTKEYYVVENPTQANGVHILRDVMDAVCKYLDTQDLYSVAQVCTIFNQTVKREMQYRCPQRVMLYEEKKDIYAFDGFIKAIPDIAIIFVPPKFSAVKQRERKLCYEYIKHFPSVLLSVRADKVFTEKNIMDTAEYDRLRSFVILNNQVPVFLMPRHSTLEIKPVGYSASTLDRVPPQSIIDKLIPSRIQHPQSVIIIFTFGCRKSYLKELMTCMQRSFKQYTLWGGELFHPPFAHYRPKEAHVHTKSLGFVGLSITNPNMDCYSLVLNCENVETDEIYREILNFKNRVKLRGRNLGLINAPDYHVNSSEEELPNEVADADHFYKAHYEKRFLFYVKQQFPNIPFINTFRDNMLNVFGVGSKNGTEEYIHNNSLSFMIITYN